MTHPLSDCRVAIAGNVLPAVVFSFTPSFSTLWAATAASLPRSRIHFSSSFSASAPARLLCYSFSLILSPPYGYILSWKERAREREREREKARKAGFKIIMARAILITVALRYLPSLFLSYNPFLYLLLVSLSLPAYRV
jgi:hypothetical protein